MAPSSGYHMVPKAVRAVRYVISRSSDFVRARLTPDGASRIETVAAAARTAQQHSIHPLAVLRQSRAHSGSRQTRLFSTAIRTLSRLGTRTVQPSATFAPSATRTALRKSTFAPFASPLRPNLTGGTLPRGAGGYGLGGGGMNAARHFSHTSSAQTHVVQNVHAAVRAFVLQGQKPLYTGTDHKGAARFRAVGPAEAKNHENLKRAKGISAWEGRGTSLDFHIAPAVTAVSGKIAAEETLSDETIQGLATDFARQLRDLAAVHADLKRLSQLGALPVSKPDAATLRVRFPGCDATAVYALCDEVGVTRGIVHEDPGWDVRDDESFVEGQPMARDADRDVEMALLFPWAPTEFSPGPYKGSDYASDEDGEAYFDYVNPSTAPHKPAARYAGAIDGVEWRSMLSADPWASPTAPAAPSVPSTPHSFAFLESDSAGPHGSPAFAFESLGTSEAMSEDGAPLAQTRTITQAPTTGYEGVEGIYRFLRELEGAEARARH